jgi:hypothetical protein
VQRDVYAEGPKRITPLDRERARVIASGGVARGGLAGVLLGLDAARLDGRPTRRDALPPERLVVINDTPCADALQTLIDLAQLLDDDRWEQALESALRKKLVTIAELEAVPAGTHGRPRIRRVLARRPKGAPPTGSIMETIALQIARPILGEARRQYEVCWPDGRFIAFVDLCWPELGIFLELDGKGHVDQPVYDATRQNAVVAATGWLPGRFTWHQLTVTPRSAARQFEQLGEQADRLRKAA